MAKLVTARQYLLVALAILFAIATTLYSAIWMYYIRWQPRLQFGLDSTDDLYHETLQVTRVARGSPVERAGVQHGDTILSINNRRPRDLGYGAPIIRGQPGDIITLLVQRPGLPAPVTLRVVLTPMTANPPNLGLGQRVAIELLYSFPVPFLLVGLTVLILRPYDRNAWLLAYMFGGLIAGAPLLSIMEGAIHPALRGFAASYMVAANGMLPAILYYFFATFPAPSPIDRRVPWLKWVFLIGGAVALPLAVWVLFEGGSRPLIVLDAKLPWHVPDILYSFGGCLLGLVALVANSLRAANPEARRKTRVMMWGTVAGLLPFLLLVATSIYLKTEYWQFPFWIWVPSALALCLMPLSFAYAVLKHRVLEVPILLKRSARYVLVQRGFVVLLFITLATTIALFLRTLSRFFPENSNLGLVLSAVFGVALLWAAAPVVKRGTDRIDRAFFRSAYDARVILQELVDKTRTVTNQHDLALLLERHVKDALHPKSMACYLQSGDSQLVAETEGVPNRLQRISATLPLLTRLAQRGKAWDVPAPESMDAVDMELLSSLSAECLVPILSRSDDLIGLLVLGPRLSEESYSGEDKRLLELVANHAGIALENMELARRMADRIEAERRAARDLEIAREVQTRLFPQRMPPLETLEYAGGCIQAQRVGGDYYDFLDLGPGRLALVLADISGKGISGALLMANLQANLRSHYALALEDLPGLLRSVNHLFYENTPEECYATLFFAVYDDATRILRYVNCGHNAPLLLGASGKFERLVATATVLGLFRDWECNVAEISLHPGELLVIYTDGITEAADASGAEFGEARLMEIVRSRRDQPVATLLESIDTAVQQFSGGLQADDLTLLIARAR